MRGPRQSFRTVVLTASLVSIAASMPLVLAVPLSMAGELGSSATGPRTETVAASQRRDTLASLVSQAARQFCKPQVAPAADRADLPRTNESQSLLLPVPPAERHVSPLLSLPKLIDLPPPLR